MSGRTVSYTDDQGEMDGLGPRMRDFLPPPDQLSPRDDGVKVTRTLSRSSVEFFKRKAKRNRVPYQRVIRALVDGYVQRHG
jgi:predicted DNA binding CopG/RHH family protein